MDIEGGIFRGAKVRGGGEMSVMEVDVRYVRGLGIVFVWPREPNKE
jgi:hypothetical protein